MNTQEQMNHIKEMIQFLENQCKGLQRWTSPTNTKWLTDTNNFHKNQPHKRLSIGSDVYVVYRYGEPVFTWTEAHSIGRFGDIKQWAGALLETQIDPTHRLN